MLKRPPSLTAQATIVKAGHGAQNNLEGAGGSFGTRAFRLILGFRFTYLGLFHLMESPWTARKLCQGSDLGVLRQLAPVSSMDTLRSAREAFNR